MEVTGRETLLEEAIPESPDPSASPSSSTSEPVERKDDESQYMLFSGTPPLVLPSNLFMATSVPLLSFLRTATGRFCHIDVALLRRNPKEHPCVAESALGVKSKRSSDSERIGTMVTKEATSIVSTMLRVSTNIQLPWILLRYFAGRVPTKLT